MGQNLHASNVREFRKVPLGLRAPWSRSYRYTLFIEYSSVPYASEVILYSNTESMTTLEESSLWWALQQIAFLDVVRYWRIKSFVKGNLSSAKFSLTHWIKNMSHLWKQRPHSELSKAHTWTWLSASEHSNVPVENISHNLFLQKVLISSTSQLKLCFLITWLHDMAHSAPSV